MNYNWWAEQKPVLEVAVEGAITSRDQAFTMAKGIVDQIESSTFPHVVLIWDLSKMGNAPSAAALLGGALPQTNKIEHLVMINAPMAFKLAAMPMFHLRNKLHFVDNAAQATAKARELLPKLPAK